MMWLNMIGAAGTAVLGFLGLIFPDRAANLVNLRAVTPAGMSEFRGTYGGLFLVMGVIPLITRNPGFFAFAGVLWAGIAVGRAISIFADRAGTRANWGALVFEAIMAFALLA